MESLFGQHIQQELENINQQGLCKHEHLILTPQSSEIQIAVDSSNKKSVLNFCANNYLGLADHPDIIEATIKALKEEGYGMASVRFICGTHAIHRKLERKLARFLGYEDAILFAACFDANGGVFEPLLTAEDAIISDALNHASIIDGIRLCKAKRYRYKNTDIIDLEKQLQKADKEGARFKLIATDGVFSMDGHIAPLKAICELAERYQAVVFVDDCHATGVLGDGGKGTPSFCGVSEKVDILTGTLGKALGGAMGGYICASQPIINLLRQRARPYLFSNSLAPALVRGALEALNIMESQGKGLRKKLFENTKRFRQGLTDAGFSLLSGKHPIIPVMLPNEQKSQEMASMLLEEGVYVVSFSYPVVPRGKARIRTQMSAAHTGEHIEYTISAFKKVGCKLGIV